MEKKNKPYKVTCLETGTTYTYMACSPFNALEKMAYYLRISHDARKPFVPDLYDRTLWFEYDGRTYATRIDVA